VKGSPRTVRVHLAERSYDILITAGSLDRAGPFVAQRAEATRAVVITDANVEHPHAVTVCRSLAEASLKADMVVVEPGERSKSIGTAASLWEKLLDLGCDRTALVVAVGGGVVGDLAGFVAATYARGVRFFQIPTSLLAQVDSAVGGKVGINLPAAKNMVGAFLQPLGVLIDTATLDTLPQREYRAGLGEVVKYGVILDAEFFGYLESHIEGLISRDRQVLAHVVARCCQLKAGVVEQDEREETALRAVLNYGHTVAHALETLTGYEVLLHGEAVAIGMICESRLAELVGRVDRSLTLRQQRLLAALGLPTRLPNVDLEAILGAMAHDKKVRYGRLRFVLPARLGHVELVEGVEADLVRRALGG